MSLDKAELCDSLLTWVSSALARFASGANANLWLTGVVKVHRKVIVTFESEGLLLSTNTYFILTLFT